MGTPCFEVVQANTCVEMRRSSLVAHDVGVVCCFGNTATFTSIWDQWSRSTAFHAHICINVLDASIVHAKYIRGPLDDASTDADNLTGTDPEYTNQVLEGVVSALLENCPVRVWVLHGASGGCATTVELARRLLALGHQILGVLADCGVPGSGDPLPRQVPVSVFRSTGDRYWNQHPAHLFDVWRGHGFAVDNEANCKADHAWAVDDKCLRQCLQWMEETHAVAILPREPIPTPDAADVASRKRKRM